MDGKTRVYVVDDDNGILESLRRLMQSDGLVVETYASAHDFLDSYCDDSPACLILDLRMPQMDGLQVQEELLRRGAALPIVFLSGAGHVEDCVRAMKEGAMDFLEKPVDYERVLESVRTALNREAARRRTNRSHTRIKNRLGLLTRREREVMWLLYDGKAIKNIASLLGLGFQTAAKHRSRVFEKLQVQNEPELIHLLADTHTKARP